MKKLLVLFAVAVLLASCADFSNGVCPVGFGGDAGVFDDLGGSRYSCSYPKSVNCPTVLGWSVSWPASPSEVSALSGMCC